MPEHRNSPSEGKIISAALLLISFVFGTEKGSEFKVYTRASLVAQLLRIHVMQGTPVQYLVWEDPTCHRCHGATEPLSHHY